MVIRNSFRDLKNVNDIYVARSWRNSEKELADKVSINLIKNKYRLVGDSKDQKGFDKENRIKSLIESCGGIIAILPDRGNGKTSKYIIEEINIAKSIDMPFVCIAENNLDEKTYNISNILSISSEENIDHKLNIELEEFNEQWRKPHKPHYVFFAKSIDTETKEKHNYVESLIEMVTGMQCIYGDQIFEREIQEYLTSKIQNSLVVLADISGHNLNTCIEVGIARGANSNYHLISKNPRKQPPFMFRDQQVWFYEDKVELLGIIHKILLPYKRRIMNYEFPSKIAWA